MDITRCAKHPSQKGKTMRKVDIFRDLQGRAGDVLDALGIDGRACFRHIHCPIPSHDDHKPSFRIIKGQERFICTCTPRGASLVDLVIAMEHATNFVDATRWLRRELAIRMTTAKPFRIENNYVENASDQKDAANRDNMIKVFAHCVDVPPFHPYLVKKGILPLGARYEATLKSIVLPIHDSDYVFQGLEYIDDRGSKFCIDGTKKTGNGLMLGNPELSPVLCVTEGWATGVSVHIALGGVPVLVTFGAGNLSAVKNFVRPKQDVWFFADNDATGIKAANDAAQELEPHGFVLLPSLTDFNEDFQSAMGQSNFVRIKQAFKNVRRQK
jgi:phage/plasmid primase-like uncharacterized protein